MLSIKHLKQAEVDSLRVNTPDVEAHLLQNLLAQIRAWLKENGHPVDKVNTLLLNKLQYFIVKELNSSNKGIRASGGWYRYGPCIEEYRTRGEEGVQDLTNIESSKGPILAAVRKICEQEVPKFIWCEEEDRKLDSKVKYSYNYLKHIYQDRNEYPELKEYYQSKNELAYWFRVFAYSKKENENLKTALVAFQKAILGQKYSSFVELKDDSQRLLVDYLTTMKKLVKLHTEPKYQKSESYWFVVRKVAEDFEKYLLGDCAYRNYLKTYKSVGWRRSERQRPFFKSNVEEFEAQTKNNIASNVAWVEKLLTET